MNCPSIFGEGPSSQVYFDSMAVVHDQYRHDV